MHGDSTVEGRCRALDGNTPKTGRYVLYWVQQTQRAFWNHALEYAIERVNELKVPVAACSGLTDRFPDANERHYAFMLEGSSETRAARARALYLNNKYFIDGRDPSGFTGVAPCFGKHDRPWAERPVFGSVRYMNANGLKRKFDIDIDTYLRRVEGMGNERLRK
jgi:deoxyribodipyrimidine photolyase